MSTEVTAESPSRRHHQSHPGVPMADCWYCQRDQATCRSKIRFADWREARAWVDEYHESRAYAEPWVRRYSCGWCGGQHMTSNLDKHDRKRVEKARRKWVRESTG